FHLFLLTRPPPRPTLFPYTTLFRSRCDKRAGRSSPEPPRAAPRSARASSRRTRRTGVATATAHPTAAAPRALPQRVPSPRPRRRSEEHTSELQSRGHLVCRLLLEKK